MLTDAFDDVENDPTAGNATQEATDDDDTIFINRATSLLSPDLQEVLRLNYGLEGSSRETAAEIAERRGTSIQSVRTATYRARQLLQEIIPQLMDGSFDFISWRVRYPLCRNAFVMAGILGLELGVRDTFQEMGVKALDALRESEQPDIAEQLSRLYGLEDLTPLTSRELEGLTGISQSTISRNERQFLQRQRELRQAKSSTSQQLQ